jgi:vitamin B12 transporter
MKGRIFAWSVGLVVAGMVAGAVCFGAEEDEVVPVMDETLVTATRTEEAQRTLGVATDVITGEEISERQARDVADALRTVPGLNLVVSGGRGGVTSLFTRGGEDNYTKILIDGVSVNLGGGAYDFGSLLTDNIEKIEIVRGPQSALYGSDAISGVINIITNRGSGKPAVHVSTANGAYLKGDNNYIGEQSVGFTGGNDWIGASLAYARVDDNGFLDVNDDYWNNTFSGRVDLYPAENLDVTLTGRYEDAKLKFPTEDAGDQLSPLDPDQNSSTADWLWTLNTAYQMSSWLEHVMLLGYRNNDVDYNDPENPPADAFGAFFSETEEERYSVDYHFNVRYPATENLKSTFTGGVEYLTEEYDQETRSIFFGSESRSKLNEDRDNWGYYAQEQLSLFDRLHLTAGARYEDNSEFGNEFVPRGSIAYELKKYGTKFRGAAGKGFKTPTFVENFSQGFAEGNPDLDPEKSVSWEVGVDQALWKNRLILGVTYFNQKFDDLIAYVATPAGQPDFENIQQAESSGVEVSASLYPGAGFTVGGSYTYLDTEVTDDGGQGGSGAIFEEGQDLLRRPAHTASGFVNWAWQGMQIRVEGFYVGERDDLDFQTFPGTRVTLDDYFIVNLAASYMIPWSNTFIKELKVFGKVRNLFDEDYEEIVGFSAPDPSFSLGVSFSM